jgi:starch phosphorylase
VGKRFAPHRTHRLYHGYGGSVRPFYLRLQHDAVAFCGSTKHKVPGWIWKKFNAGIIWALLAPQRSPKPISKVLYPNDSHLEGKKLRLKQQYFLASATIGDIIRQHLNAIGSLANLAEKNAVQLNDTHTRFGHSGAAGVLWIEFGFGWTSL